MKTGRDGRKLSAVSIHKVVMPVVLSVVFALALACSEPLKAPTLKPEPITAARISKAGAEIDSVLEGNNPNKAQLTARSVETNMTLGGKAGVAKVLVTASIVLPANGTTKVQVPIRVEWTDPAAVAELAAKKEQAQFVVEGSVEFSDGRQSIKAPFQVSGVMTPADLAQAAGTAPAPAASAAPAPSASARR